MADHGTLFLDEIADLPIELQPKLLRVIQEREFERLGSSHTTRVDVRRVAATNQPLEQMVAERRFRTDLYYRLNVFPITLPPLRERTGDVPLLVDHFVGTYAGRYGKSIDGIPGDVMRAMVGYDWPGNVRRLQNVIECSVIRSGGLELWAPIDELTNKAIPAPSVHSLADADGAHIVSTLHQTNWVIGGRNGAAVRLGLKQTTLIANMRKLGISRDTEGQCADRCDAAF